MQNATFIDEPNLYRCIFQSKKKEAVEFQDWVFEEVLPKLREQSQIQSNHSKPLVALPGISADVKELARLEEENQKMRIELDRLRKTAEPTFKTSDIAEELGMTAQELYYCLRKLRIMAWCQSTNKHILHPELQGNGFTELVKKFYRYRDGSEREFVFWAWTRKGRAYLIDRLRGNSVDKYFDDVDEYAEEN